MDKMDANTKRQVEIEFRSSFNKLDKVINFILVSHRPLSFLFIKFLKKDQSGFLDYKELTVWFGQLAKEINIELTESDRINILNQIDQDKNGRISFEEFKKYLN